MKKGMIWCQKCFETKSSMKKPEQQH